MAKTIFTIGKTETKVEAEGFTGGSCEEAIKQITDRMDGAQEEGREFLPEFFEGTTETETEL